MKKIFTCIVIFFFILNFACQKMLDPIVDTSVRSISLISPLNNQSLNPENILLRWDCQTAISYSVYFDTIPHPEKIIANKISEDSLNVYELYYNKNYYWRVIAFFENRDSISSVINQFRTIAFNPLSSISLLYINFPKAELSIYQSILYDSWSPQDDDLLREDTLIQKIVYTENPMDCQDNSVCSIDTNEYNVIGNTIFFNIRINKSFSDGMDGYSSKTSIKGQFELDTLSSNITLVMNFKNKYHSNRTETGDSNDSKWVSEIYLEGVPYQVNNQCLEFSIDSTSIESYLKYFNYMYEKSSSSDLNHESVTIKKIMLSVIGFENDKNFIFRIIPHCKL